MPLETATYLPDLVASNPAHSDGLNQADSHIRLIKATIKATFPNFTDVALSSTQAALDAAATAIAGAGTGYMVPIGSVVDFAGATAPTGYLACDGQAVSRTTYAGLFAALGTTWGAGDGSTTFNVPNLQSRFRRHRDGNANLAGAVGNTQAPANLAHTHGVSGNTGTESASHYHNVAGYSGSMNQNTTVQLQIPSYANNGVGGGSTYVLYTAMCVNSTGGSAYEPMSTNAQNIDHEHYISINSGTESANHTHAISLTSAGGSADNAYEARPYSATMLACIRAL